jgi:hypothetical protein
MSMLQEDTLNDSQQEKMLIEKIRTLPPERLAEVEDFIDFLNLKSQDRRLMSACNKLAEGAFHKVWDNAEDDEYDRI